MKLLSAKHAFFSAAFLLFATFTFAQTVLPVQQDRWTIQPDGSIRWDVNGRLPHTDHIEMSGEKVSLWVRYGLDSSGRSDVFRTVVFPTFRMLPDATRSHISSSFTDADLPKFYVNNRLVNMELIKNGPGRNGELSYNVKNYGQSGIMRIGAQAGTPALVNIGRSLYPSVDKPMALETFTFKNVTDQPVTVSMEYLRKETRTDAKRSKTAQHSIITGSVNDGSQTLAPGQTASFSVFYLATDTPGNLPPIDPQAEENARAQRVAGIKEKLRLETPDQILNTAFAFAKLRATESIFKTKGGYMHGPGGLAYYAAIWANDQAEYINPFFAFLGDRTGNLSAMNAYRHFARFMNDNYKPIPSSIVAEGDATWHGAKDRGDQAMIAYGASRYALTFGNADSAKVLWPLIEWCLEYSRRKLNDRGVVNSDSDELENRFSAGKANLSTNILYYDALRSAAMLGQQLGKPSAQTAGYVKQAAALRANIEKYFGANVEGFETYRYHEGLEKLRAWICLPLTVGIMDRKEGTIAALFSPRLWTADGLATEAGKGTFWDRSTLYALRGVLQSGETEKAMDFIRYYSRRRLLGEHVPYPVEAYPEGNQRHLSAESGLYCRIYTEGLFGMRPTGFTSFDCTPRLPKDWNNMALRSISAFGQVFDLEVTRGAKGKLDVVVKKENGAVKKYSVKDGGTLAVKL
ncbi:hypothetical protein ACFOTA_08755 [Chitinophaga sp. GCM10012297]|uniref:Uncharacterized protein n=1 Tax=Chitinophaga chungangae TaxID=2821488 RepID=A0ABS3YC88_9BACT|nr:hypothetical protein [Chitinophaga chungangae]MBO9152293.1 hypothetical protein [Chitinophaga chungangae]